MEKSASKNETRGDKTGGFPKKSTRVPSDRCNRKLPLADAVYFSQPRRRKYQNGAIALVSISASANG